MGLIWSILFAVNNRARVFDAFGHIQQAKLLMKSMLKLQSERSKNIDTELKKEAAIREKELKILLLGASDSGKSTIVKQMRILHTDGFSDSERHHYKAMIHSNYIDCFRHIAKGIYSLGIVVQPMERELVNTYAQTYSSHQFMDLTGMIGTFLNFTCVREAYQRINEFYAPDNTEYLIENASRILSPAYAPTIEDIIHARTATKGIYELNFAFRAFTIRMIDVGGQKTERRKWIHCFEGAAAVLFIVSLSCYNQLMEEDNQISQMADTIALFKSVYRDKFLRSSSFIMFLNKKDLFCKKLQYVPLQRFFPSFEGNLHPNMDEEELYNKAIEFFKQMFTTVRGKDKRPVYTHVTTAINTQNIDFVFTATCDIIIAQNMRTAGMS